MKKVTNTIPNKKFSADIDWSIRFLSIYNIDRNYATKIVEKIVKDLSMVHWSKPTESLRQDIFRERLRQSVQQHKAMKAIAA